MNRIKYMFWVLEIVSIVTTILRESESTESLQLPWNSSWKFLLDTSTGSGKMSRLSWSISLSWKDKYWGSEKLRELEFVGQSARKEEVI